MGSDVISVISQVWSSPMNLSYSYFSIQNALLGVANWLLPMILHLLAEILQSETWLNTL